MLLPVPRPLQLQRKLLLKPKLLLVQKTKLPAASQALRLRPAAHRKVKLLPLVVRTVQKPLHALQVLRQALAAQRMALKLPMPPRQRPAPKPSR